MFIRFFFLVFSTNYMVVADYNKRIGKKAVAFAGLGIGMCNIESSNDLVYEGSDIMSEIFTNNGTSGSVAVMPRVGLTLWAS